MQTVNIAGQAVTLIALPAIFEQFHDLGKAPSADVVHELLEMVKIYNAVPVEQEAGYLAMLAREYSTFGAKVLA